MSESLSIDDGWEESLDSEQVTHVKGEIAAGVAPHGEWLVNVSEQVVVPLTTVDVVEALRARRITDRSLVWRAGMQDWTPLGEVPQLRLAAGPLAAASRAPIPSERAPIPSERGPIPSERASAPPSDRTLRPPPKEPARAARDERARRNTLPFGFPVVRDPATIREPAGLHSAPAPAVAAVPAPAPVATPPVPATDDVDALAIYERAAPSLTFSDSVRAEWQGTNQLVHQPAPSPPPAVVARPAPRARVETPAAPRIEPKARLTLEPQLDPRPRLTLTLEPQSDPLQTARVEPQLKLSGSPPPSSLAPTTSEPDHELPARGAGMWGDLSVVLASDMRAVKQSSKRVTLIASLGSAALASLLTFWFAHSSSRPATAQPAVAVAAQSPPAVAPPQAQADTTVAPPAAVSMPAPSATHAAATVAHSAPAVHAAPKPAPAAAPRVASHPRPSVGTEPGAAEATSATADANPYADPSEPPAHGDKMPTAAFKETSAASADEPTRSAPPPSVSSGLEDSANPARTAPTAAPGF